MGFDLATLSKIVRQRPQLRLAEKAMEALSPHFDESWNFRAHLMGDPLSPGFNIALMARIPADGQPVLVLNMFFTDEFVSVPNMFLPDEMKHRGTMIGVLGRMTHLGASMGYAVVVSELTEVQCKRLLRRGAVPLERDVVLLQTDMNFEPYSVDSP